MAYIIGRSRISNIWFYPKPILERGPHYTHPHCYHIILPLLNPPLHASLARQEAKAEISGVQRR